MIEKIKIVEKLSEREILLPALISTALAANDRIKLKLSSLQQAGARARGEAHGGSDFGDPAMDRLVQGARPLNGATFLAPGAGELAAAAAADITDMLAPLEAAGTEPGSRLKARADALLSRLPTFAQDRVAQCEVAALAAATRGGEDSLHLLVMDLHKEINRLAAANAPEKVDGAFAYGLDDEGRTRVRAFMAGLNRTAPLAFGHPGLGTTAAQSAGRLTIQNDIGMTDAHVLVVHVVGGEARWTYTDVHRLRAEFFISLFEGEPVAWSTLGHEADEKLAEGEGFYQIEGRLNAADVAELDRFLEHFASRIVFLIDWNKARKALQSFVPKVTAVRLLREAARREEGHRAFLELGGVDLVYEAVRRGASGRIAYGQPLAEALGPEQTQAFLASVLATACEGLKEGRSARLIGDELQTDLAARLDSAERELLRVMLRHLGLTRTQAGMIESAVGAGPNCAQERRRRIASRSKQIEAKADRLTLEARAIVGRVSHAGALSVAVDQIEDATDTFDEAAFLISLASGRSLEALSLSQLAGVAVESVGSLVRAVEATLRLHEGKSVDSVFALQCVDEVIDAERRADVAERAAIGALFGVPGEANARDLVLGLEIARTLESATDRLAHAAISLRERVLEELSA